MKKVFTIAILSLYFATFAQVPTCGYDHTYIASGKKGIWPDSAINFSAGTVGTPYIQNVTIVIPQDTTATVFSQTQTFTITTINLQTNVLNPVNYGLPPGLQLTGTPSNFQFPGNDSSCMAIYGTPTTPGTFHLAFILKAYVTSFPNIPVKVDTIKYYRIVISPQNGIAEYGGNSFKLMGCYPNPAAGESIIHFNSQVETAGSISFFDLTGKKIGQNILMAHQGENAFPYNSTTLENGVYFYTLEINNQKQCGKLMIAK